VKKQPLGLLFYLGRVSVFQRIGAPASSAHARKVRESLDAAYDLPGAQSFRRRFL
jgi:hypothetical protein